MSCAQSLDLLIVRAVVAQAESSPVDTFPCIQVWFGDMVLQRSDGAVGVFSFEGRFEIWREPTYKTKSYISKRMHWQDLVVI